MRVKKNHDGFRDCYVTTRCPKDMPPKSKEDIYWKDGENILKEEKQIFYYSSRIKHLFLDLNILRNFFFSTLLLFKTKNFIEIKLFFMHNMPCFSCGIIYYYFYC